MNTKNLLIACLAGGAASTLLSNVPFLNLVNCLLCAGFWGGALLAVWLYKRLTGTVTLGQGVIIGTLAGLVAGIFGFALSFVGLAGSAALLESYERFVPPEARGDLAALPSGPMQIIFNLLGVVTNIIFGAIGGLAGGALFKTRIQPPAPPSVLEEQKPTDENG